MYLGPARKLKIVWTDYVRRYHFLFPVDFYSYGEFFPHQLPIIYTTHCYNSICRKYDPLNAILVMTNEKRNLPHTHLKNKA